MNILVRVGLSSVFAALIMQSTTFFNKLIFWKDTVPHRSISLCIIFMGLALLFYFATASNIDSGYSESRVLLPLATLLLLAVIAINILNIDSVIALPKVIVTYADMWYAIPGAVGIYLLTLFFTNRF